MKVLFVFNFMIFFFLSSTFGQAKSEEDILNAKWKVFDSENFVISHPNNWDVDQSGQMGTSFMLFSPLTSKEDRFKENVNLIVQDLTGFNLDLDQFIQMSEEQIKTMLVDGKIITSKRLEEEGQDIHMLTFSGTQGVFDLEFDQLCFIKKEKAYIVTFTYEASEKEKYRELGTDILKSFRVKKY